MEAQPAENQKLIKIREKIKELGLDAYIVFHNDAHSSEYLAVSDERIKFISGFSGSNGICVITQDHALMWTDGRYYLQAEQQLESGWKMMKWQAGATMYFEWLSENLSSGGKIGVDPAQIAVASYRNRSKYFKEKNMEMITITENLVDTVWSSEKPPVPQNKVFIHDVKYAGLSVQEKFEKVNTKLDKKADHLLVSSLDDIDWLVNLRGSDINYNPVFFAYAIFNVAKDEGAKPNLTLFINPDKICEEDIQKHLKDNNIETLDYNQIVEHLRSLVANGKKIGYDENVCNQQLFEAIKDSEPINYDAIVEHVKAAKNPVEMEGMRNANVKNCASLVQYFAWMEDHLKNNSETDQTEYTAAKKLEEFRMTRDLYKGPSFDTISSIGPNGAVIHYKPKKATALKMNNTELYLLDSGVQYLDGTTDITRTVQFGGCEPTAEQKDRYTRVLLGVLDLERVVWPNNGPYSGGDFDTLARMHLWADGVDYNHGTGHGVGSFNCVHEGPQGIYRSSKVKLEVGMCVSDEPGYYKDGEYGIRIENVIMVVNHPKFADRLKFENMTICPYARELIDKTLLSPNDISYINEFHKKCEEILTPLLQDDKLALEYLQRKCAAL